MAVNIFCLTLQLLTHGHENKEVQHLPLLCPLPKVSAEFLVHGNLLPHSPRGGVRISERGVSRLNEALVWTVISVSRDEDHFGTLLL